MKEYRVHIFKYHFSCWQTVTASLSLKSHLENTGYELLQRYTTNEFVVRMPAEYGGAQERIAKVAALVGDA